MKNRYVRNTNTLSPDETEMLARCRVLVVGCGGLGGYVIQQLGRLGVGYITAVDGDVFDETNLNRQLFSDESVLGKPKASVVKEKMAVINSEVTVNAICDRLTGENGADIVGSHQLAVDALDNISSRKLLAKLCAEAGIPLVHGAIAGWHGQVCTVLPGDTILDDIYPDGLEKGMETVTGNPAFTPGLVASLQVSEAVKLLTGRGEPLRNKLLTMSLFDNGYDIIDFR